MSGGATTLATITLRTRRLFGYDFVTGADIPGVARAVLDLAEGDGRAWSCVVTANVDHLVRYEDHPEEAAVAAGATIVIPDGMPIVWASRLLRRPLSARLAGSDLFSELWRHVEDGRVPAAVVASSAEVATHVRAAGPDVGVVVPPMFDVDDEPAVAGVVESVADACTAVGARLLFVGVSMPKHHLIASRLARRWEGSAGPLPVVLLIGASPELHFGLVPRAPRWMQRTGTEWLHRLAREPRRLARRYLVDDLRFLPLVWREWRGSRPSRALAS